MQRYISKSKYPKYIPQNFSDLDAKATAADAQGYARSDADFANRRGNMAEAENLFEDSVLQDQRGDSTLSPAMQSEFMRAGIQGSLGAFGDSPGTLAPGSAGEASVARNLGLKIADFQDRNRQNRERSLGLGEQIFQRRKIGLSGEDAATIAAANVKNTNDYAQGKFQSDVQKEQYKYNAKVGERNAQMAKQNADAAADSAETGAMVSGAGAVAGLALLLLMCWVAREVYGKENNDWRLFRSWLLSDSAPLWLFDLYWSHGENVAKWISRNTWSKPLFRFFMNFAVNKVKNGKMQCAS